MTKVSSASRGLLNPEVDQLLVDPLGEPWPHVLFLKLHVWSQGLAAPPAPSFSVKQLNSTNRTPFQPNASRHCIA